LAGEASGYSNKGSKAERFGISLYLGLVTVIDTGASKAAS
jgi:hypothetical protein